MFDKTVYQLRRKRLKEQVGKGLILLLGNEQSSMNYKDNPYHFRQDSNFLYFFGMDRPGLVGMIDIENDRDTIFGAEPSIDDIVWLGPQRTLSEQAAEVGIAHTAPLEAIRPALESAQSKHQLIHFPPPYRPENTWKLSAWLNMPYLTIKDHASVSLIRAIVAQRSIKSPEEVAEIELAVDITSQMHLAAIRGAREGMSEAQLAGVLHGIAISSGGDLAFPIILTVNGQVLHNHYGKTIMRDGQLAICDSGAENALHYAGDLTRTFPVAKKFSALQKEMYEVVLGAQQAATEALRPGILFRDVHLIACEKLAEGLKAAGLMKGDPKEAVAAGAHAQFFQCGLGHMMGLDVHDMEDLGEPYVGYSDTLKKSTEFGLKSLRLGRELEPGFVVTVEPGLYFIPELMDRWGAEKKFEAFINYDKLKAFRSFGGIRIEDDYLVTAEGSRLLGKPLPKKAEEIEALRG